MMNVMMMTMTMINVMLLCSVMAQQLVDLAIDVLREAVTTYHTENMPSSDTMTVNSSVSDGPTDKAQQVAAGDGSLTENSSSCCRETSVQLFYTARSVFEMFASLVPVYHRHLLSTLPQLAGENITLIDRLHLVMAWSDIETMFTVCTKM